MPAEVWGVIAFIGVVVLVVGIALGRRTPKKHSPVPSERGALTKYIKKHRSGLERAKRTGKDYTWVKQVGSRIIALGNQGLLTADMSGREVLAAIFAVNQHSHDHPIKDYLIGVVLTHKRAGVKVRNGKGRYQHTLEITAGPFCSHAPKVLVQNGSLDRRTGQKLSRSRFRS
ncbi:MAG: hypothetical protein WAV15_03985 [Minisyncoccia bacterium]